MSIELTKEAIAEVLAAGIPTSIEPVIIGDRMRGYLSRHPTGKPYYIEDWEYARGWVLDQTVNGTGTFEVVTGAEYPLYGYDHLRPAVFNGKSMCKITSCGVAGGRLYLYYCHAPLPSERIGVEVNWAWPYSQAYLQARMSGFVLAGVWRDFEDKQYQPRLLYGATTDTLYFDDGAGQHTLLENVYATHYRTESGFLIWQNAKLILDLANGVGVKAYFNEREFDLSSYNLAVLTRVHPQNVVEVFLGPLDVGVQSITYLGNILLTKEEP